MRKIFIIFLFSLVTACGEKDFKRPTAKLSGEYSFDIVSISNLNGRLKAKSTVLPGKFSVSKNNVFSLDASTLECSAAENESTDEEKFYSCRFKESKIPLKCRSGNQNVCTADFGGLEAIHEVWSAENRKTVPQLRISAGESFGVSPALSGFFRDIPTIQGLSLLGLHVDGFGSHSFDRNLGYMQRLIDLSPYYYVATNFSNVPGNLNNTHQYAVFNVPSNARDADPLKVAVFGVTNRKSLERVFPGRFGDLVLNNYCMLREAMHQAYRGGAESFLVLSQIPVSANKNEGNEDIVELLRLLHAMKMGTARTLCDNSFVNDEYDLEDLVNTDAHIYDALVGVLASVSDKSNALNSLRQRSLENNLQVSFFVVDENKLSGIETVRKQILETDAVETGIPLFINSPKGSHTVSLRVNVKAQNCMKHKDQGITCHPRVENAAFIPNLLSKPYEEKVFPGGKGSTDIGKCARKSLPKYKLEVVDDMLIPIFTDLTHKNGSHTPSSDSSVREFIDFWDCVLAQYDFAETIGSLSEDLKLNNTDCRKNSCALGNLITSIMMKYYDADAALINSGMMRGSLMKSVTPSSLWELNAFGNAIVEVGIKPSKIAKILSYSLNKQFAVDFESASNYFGGALQIAGVSFCRYETFEELKKKYGGKPVDEWAYEQRELRIYKIAQDGKKTVLYDSRNPEKNSDLPLRVITTDYLYFGGDRYLTDWFLSESVASKAILRLEEILRRAFSNQEIDVSPFKINVSESDPLDLPEENEYYPLNNLYSRHRFCQ